MAAFCGQEISHQHDGSALAAEFGGDAAKDPCRGTDQMSVPSTDDLQLVGQSLFYQEFLAERDEILRHKWLQSEKAGYDIGFEKALLQWIGLHRACWVERRRQWNVEAHGRSVLPMR
jgi:hypothetical protein